MAKRMLIDSTHPEETRVAVISGNRLEEFDFESARKKQIKGNVYLAKVTRVEPSLQACFVEYGGNRHGFLAFNEIHPDYYRIPVADREALNRLVAEAMAAQDDEDEPEERRPRRRRGRWRRRGGDSDENQARSDSDDTFAGANPGTSQADNEPSSGERSIGSDQPGAEETDQLLQGGPLNGDEAPTEPSAQDDAPTYRDDAPDRERAPLDMAAPERTASEPVEGRRDDPAPAYGQYDPQAEASSPPPDDHDRSAEDAPTSPPSFEGAPTPRHGDEFGDTPVGDHHADVEPMREAARNGDTGEPAPAEESVETVGGDDVEDIRRRHRSWQRRYKIQEVIRKRQILLVQVAKEERGNKGAALTTYISLAGRYCVLMPNTPRGGGISRKITSQTDRRRLKEIVGELEVPDGMAVIVRTAGMERSKPELRRDLDFLLSTWDDIRQKALDSTAPALIYEEANLIKRAVRDLYTKDVEEITVDGDEGYEAARSFMKLLMPTHIKKVVHYSDKQIPLFHRFQVESQIDNMHSPSVQLRSGGYIVLNPTEALVAIDVNSGRSTRERNIEETATRTNLEAADEVARQLRLRDLAGLIVIDFIDMEESRNRHAVERRLKEALRHDRARIQVGRISPFGLLEMSRQRLRPSLVEASMMQCPHCGGAGHVRSTESMSLTVLRAVEEEGLRQRSAEVTVAVPTAVALYIFNHKRGALAEIEKRHNFRVVFQPDETMGLSTYRILRNVPKAADVRQERAPQEDRQRDESARDGGQRDSGQRDSAARDHDRDSRGAEPQSEETDRAPAPVESADEPVRAEDRAGEGEARAEASESQEERRDGESGEGERRGRRRGRRGGRRRRGRQREEGQSSSEAFDEPSHESTLGPFGEDRANGSAADHQQEARGQDDFEPAAPAVHDDARRPRAPEQSDAHHEGEHRAAASAPSESVSVPAVEPAPAPVSAPEPIAAEPAEPAEPPAPVQPPQPPKRGWWNLRRS